MLERHSPGSKIRSDGRAAMETDSLLTSIYGRTENLLELGHVVDAGVCSRIFQMSVLIILEEVARDLAKVPYFLNCFNI